MTSPPPRPVSLVNLPNALTVLRLILVPVFLLALFAHGGHDPLWRWIAFVVFAVAAITDRYDGHIARQRGQVTDFGKIADPIADKALTGMAFIGLSILGDIWWAVTVVVLLREWAVTLLRLSVLKRVVIAAADLGKWKTTFQALALGGLCLPLRDPDLVDWLQTPGEVLFYGFQACLVVAVALVGPLSPNDNLAPYALYVTLWVGLIPASLTIFNAARSTAGAESIHDSTNPTRRPATDSAAS